MKIGYPFRPKAPIWVRIPCMIFGSVCVFNAGFALVQPQGQSPAFLLGGIVVGAVWFAFGFYGGLPLINTVRDWSPSVDTNDLTESSRSGLRTMRWRKWAMWASEPIFGLTILLLVQRYGVTHAETIFFSLAIPMIALIMVYWLSRCPRCGYGFFADSTNRAAFLKRTKVCSHCGLRLNADKV